RTTRLVRAGGGDGAGGGRGDSGAGAGDGGADEGVGQASRLSPSCILKLETGATPVLRSTALAQERPIQPHSPPLNKLRWGILSTANIATKTWQAIYHSGDAIVAAVASRDLERSRQFIKKCQAEARFDSEPAALGSYEALLASKDVDAVYLPLPTGLRKEWVL